MKFNGDDKKNKTYHVFFVFFIKIRTIIIDFDHVKIVCMNKYNRYLNPAVKMIDAPESLRRLGNLEFRRKMKNYNVLLQRA